MVKKSLESTNIKSHKPNFAQSTAHQQTTIIIHLQILITIALHRPQMERYLHHQTCYNKRATMPMEIIHIITIILTIIIRIWHHQPITRIPIILIWFIVQMEACLMIEKFIQCWNQLSKVRRNYVFCKLLYWIIVLLVVKT